MIAPVRRWLTVETRTTRGMMIAVWMVVVGACFGAVFGTREALDRVQDEGRQRAAEQCASRVDSRAALRGVFLDLYALIDTVADPELATFLDTARRQLDEAYPTLELTDCQEEP